MHMKLKAMKRAEADARNKAWQDKTAAQKLAYLDANNLRAVKQRTKINATKGAK